MLSSDELALLEAIRDSGSLSRAAWARRLQPFRTPRGSWRRALMRCCSIGVDTACS
jgi:hypothetical protein